MDFVKELETIEAKVEQLKEEKVRLEERKRKLKEDREAIIKELKTFNIPNEDYEGWIEKEQKAIEEASRIAEEWCLDQAVADLARSEKAMRDAGLDLHQFPQEESDKMAETGLAAVKRVMEVDVGADVWKEAMAMRDATKDGKLTAKEVFKARKLF